MAAEYGPRKTRNTARSAAEDADYADGRPRKTRKTRKTLIIKLRQAQRQSLACRHSAIVRVVTEQSPHGYYGLPTIKPPVWTWEVPSYFFVGGAAGAAAVIASVARVNGGQPDLVRDARWIAAVGGLASPALLIGDLGRPERFLNMLRVFKLQSPMSVGAWTLVAFSNAAAAAACCDAIRPRANGRIPVRTLGNAAEALASASGLVLSTYTGVLIGATAIPAWSENVRILPLHFGASGLGTAVSVLELMGHRSAALNALGAGAAVVETLIGASLELSANEALGTAQRGHER